MGAREKQSKAKSPRQKMEMAYVLAAHLAEGGLDGGDKGGERRDAQGIRVREEGTLEFRRETRWEGEQHPHPAEVRGSD